MPDRLAWDRPVAATATNPRYRLWTLLISAQAEIGAPMVSGKIRESWREGCERGYVAGAGREAGCVDVRVVGAMPSTASASARTRLRSASVDPSCNVLSIPLSNHR